MAADINQESEGDFTDPRLSEYYQPLVVFFPVQVSRLEDYQIHVQISR